MSLFSKIFTKKEEKMALQKMNAYFQTLTAYAPTFYTFGGGIYESELVRSAIDALARHSAKLKIEIEGNSKISRLKYHPNEFQTWYQFLYRARTILEVHNNLFLIPIYDRFGTITGIYTALPQNVQLMEYNDEPWIRYQFMNGQTAAIEMKACQILTKHQYSHDFFGEGNSALMPTMELINIDNQGIQEAVKNSATFRFMAKLGNFSNDNDLRKERDAFTALNMKSDLYSEKNGAGGVLLFPFTWEEIKQIDSKPFTVDPEERKLIQTNVYNYFGVNEDVLQNKAFGDAWNGFYEGAIETFAIQLSEGLSRMLFTEREIAFGSHVMATSNRLQYMSNTDKLNVSAQMADRGILNRDEVREIWNLPPLPNGEGQSYIIRGEYYSANEKLIDTEDEVTEDETE